MRSSAARTAVVKLGEVLPAHMLQVQLRLLHGSIGLDGARILRRVLAGFGSAAMTAPCCSSAAVCESWLFFCASTSWCARSVALVCVSATCLVRLSAFFLVFDRSTAQQAMGDLGAVGKDVLHLIGLCLDVLQLASETGLVLLASTRSSYFSSPSRRAPCPVVEFCSVLIEFRLLLSGRGRRFSQPCIQLGQLIERSHKIVLRIGRLLLLSKAVPCNPAPSSARRASP